MLTSRVALNIALGGTNISTALLIMPRHRELFGPLLDTTGGFLALDLLSYGMHRAQHSIPLLWRFHRIHHSDTNIGLSTAVRHHPAEFLSSGLVFWIAVALLGVSPEVAAVHSLTTLILASLTHMRSRWPKPLEHLLRPIVITLDLHLTHHSANQKEANTNFGGVLSVWDRLFGTYRESLRPLVFGVPPMLIETSRQVFNKEKMRLRGSIVADDGTVTCSIRGDYHPCDGRAVPDFVRTFVRETGLPKEFARDNRIHNAFDHERLTFDPFL